MPASLEASPRDAAYEAAIRESVRTLEEEAFREEKSKWGAFCRAGGSTGKWKLKAHPNALAKPQNVPFRAEPFLPGSGQPSTGHGRPEQLTRCEETRGEDKGPVVAEKMLKAALLHAQRFACFSLVFFGLVGCGLGP